MNAATEALRNEHRSLHKCLKFTENVAGQIRYGEDVQPGKTGAGNRWVIAALDFVDLMRDHIIKEEEAVLFMMADSFLQPPEQAEIAVEVGKNEQSLLIACKHAGHAADNAESLQFCAGWLQNHHREATQ